MKSGIMEQFMQCIRYILQQECQKYFWIFDLEKAE